MSQYHNHENCAYCACHNPMWSVLRDTLFSDENIEKLTQSCKVTINQESKLETNPIMYSGGTIRPMIDGNTDPVKAIGFDKGEVVAVGTVEEVSVAMESLGLKPENHFKLTGEETLLPGLIEPHVHIVPTALTMGWNDFSPFEGQNLIQGYNPDYLIKKLKQIKVKVRGNWILAYGVDPSLMPFTVGKSRALNRLATIDVTTLDDLNIDHPIFMLAASMHTVYVNSLALDKIYEHLPEKQKSQMTKQEYIEKIKKQGALQELEQIQPAYRAIPRIQIAEMLLGITNHLDSIFKIANARGVTLMYDAGMTSELKKILDVYRAVHQHDVRIGYAELCESLEDAKKLGSFDGVTNVDIDYQGSVKLVSDGSNQGLTGYQSEYYCCEPPENYGLFNYTNPPDASGTETEQKPDYQAMVNQIIGKGWPMMIHANGDQAIDFALDVYQNALQGQSGLDKRHRIEHCSLLTPSRAQRVRELGLSPSFLIGHVGYWGYTFRYAIFEEKAEQLDLCSTMLGLGAKITLHSDMSVSPLGPLRMMEQAVTRIMEQAPDNIDRVLNSAEKITREQALRAITLDAAWQCHADKWIGSLAKGKLADFVVLAQDPLTLKEPTGIRDIPVLQTWVAGILRYSNKRVTETAVA